ncbi:MAG TPA: class I SAM-dependent methyltransferase [Burkholderiaceae bacterium]
MQPGLKRRLLDDAAAPYRATGTFNYRWARSKLGHDPMFTALIELAIFPDGARVLDLGCGRGLLAAWFLAAERLAAQGRWPDAVKPPRGLRFRGVDLMAREADCGNRALQPLYGEQVRLSGGDMRRQDYRGSDVVAILDALHYVAHAEQDRMLDEVRAALDPGGVLLTRIGDAGAGLRFALSRACDLCVAFAQGHRHAGIWGRSLAEWIGALESRGFTVQSVPMSAGTPFANVMLIARVA